MAGHWKSGRSSNHDRTVLWLCSSVANIYIASCIQTSQASRKQACFTANVVLRSSIKGTPVQVGRQAGLDGDSLDEIAAL